LDARVVSSVDEFAALAPQWDRLAAGRGVPTPFQSFAWLEQWLRYRRGGVQPRVLVLDGGDTIAPLGVTSVYGTREIRMLGAPDSDYVDLVTARPIGEAWDLVASALAARRRSFDVVHLQSVRDREPIVAALMRHLGGQGCERVYERCPWIATDQSWDALRKSRRNGLAAEIRRWDRRVRELGDVKVEQVAPPLGADLIAELEDVERESWKWELGESAFRSGSQREFLLALLRDSRADVTVWLMRLSGRLVAYAVVLIGTNRWYYYLPSFRKSVANAGASLLAQIVEAACAGGSPVVDLLRGDHGYKRVWSERVDEVHEVVWPSSLRGRAAALAYQARWWAARSERLHRLRARISGGGDRRSSEASSARA
jgi:CelD/BcsL family acetyltransferase involved in cellulose biosynthesis